VIVVDSSVWIDHFNGRPTAEVLRLGSLLSDRNQPIIVGDIVMYEVLCGVRSIGIALEIKERLEKLLLVPMLGFELVYQAIANYRVLRSRGITIKAADVFIGTYCIESGAELLTSDRDFLSMRDHLGLRLVNPTS
jgi:predicted nucleic acid-binding protein